MKVVPVAKFTFSMRAARRFSSSAGDPLKTLFTSLPIRYLYNCRESAFDPKTKQRYNPTNDSSSIPSSIVSVLPTPNGAAVIFNNDTTTTHFYPQSFIDQINPNDRYPSRILWHKSPTEFSPHHHATVDFNLISSPPQSQEQAQISENPEIVRCMSLFLKFGLVVVKNVPTSSPSPSPSNPNSWPIEEISLLASALSQGSKTSLHKTLSAPHYKRPGGVLHTLYGGIWSTKSDDDTFSTSSEADSAYTSDPLPLHTDLTYALIPPEIQLFLCKKPASAKNAGNSSFSDAFSALEILRTQDVNSFNILTNGDGKSGVRFRYWSVDKENGFHLMNGGRGDFVGTKGVGGEPQ